MAWDWVAFLQRRTLGRSGVELARTWHRRSVEAEVQQAEADLKAQAASQEVRDLENRVVQEVRIAWLDAKTSYQRLDLTGELLSQAAQALDLAQSRYDLGLSSIVELSQAQLNKTSAEIANVSARYDCQIQTAILSFQTGQLR